MCYIIRFLVGGFLMLFLHIISQRSVSLAGILSALPIFSGAVLFMSICQSGKTCENLMSQASGGVVGMIIGMIFYISIVVALSCQYRGMQAFSIGSVICLIITVIAIYLK